ncbi:MAG: hypothetical protein KIT84_16580 [Labilithrix sp.]|nr:hypothetical protein [Labilithrix sp.]MCW5812647.1 hypothetical protein [Labilithrix sp.]
MHERHGGFTDEKRKARSGIGEAEGKRVPSLVAGDSSDEKRKARSLGGEDVEGKHVPRSLGGEAEGKRVPRSLGGEAEGKRIPRSVGGEAEGKRAPRSVGGEAEGKRVLRSGGGEGVEGRRVMGGEVEGEWKALSAAGNDAFRRGDEREARELYGLAVAEAERLWRLARAGDAVASFLAPALYTIACHNLAELERRAGDGAASRAWLERAFERLVAAARDGALPLALRARAVQNLKHALAEIVEHSPGSSAEALAPVVAHAMDAWLCVRALHERNELGTNTG